MHKCSSSQKIKSKVFPPKKNTKRISSHRNAHFLGWIRSGLSFTQSHWSLLSSTIDHTLSCWHLPRELPLGGEGSEHWRTSKHLPFPKAKTSKATFCQWRPTRQSFGNILSVPPGYKYVGHVPSSVMGRLSSRKTSLSFQKPNLLDSTLEEFTTCLAHRSSKRLNVKEKKKLFFLFVYIDKWNSLKKKKLKSSIKGKRIIILLNQHLLEDPN